MRLFAFVLLLLIPSPASAQCTGASLPMGEPCGPIEIAGCCDGDMLYFCEGGELCGWDCSNFPSCGWSESLGMFDCKTGGGAAPSGSLPLACPAPSEDECQGVDYSGCCAGQVVHWCAGGLLANLDCSGNPQLTACGYSADKEVADCVPPGSTDADECPFAGGDVVPGADVTGGRADVSSPPDIGASLDGILVPDVNAPAECASLAAGYTVESADCGGFGSGFSPKQDGCAMVLVGLLSGQHTHPSGWATKSGIAFQYMDSGKEKQCMGQFVGDAVEGKCYWDESECQFRFLKMAEPEVPEPENDGSGGGGGCSTKGRNGAGPPAALLLLLLLATLRVSARACGRAFRAAS